LLTVLLLRGGGVVLIVPPGGGVWCDITRDITVVTGLRGRTGGVTGRATLGEEVLRARGVVAADGVLHVLAAVVAERVDRLVMAGDLVAVGLRVAGLRLLPLLAARDHTRVARGGLVLLEDRLTLRGDVAAGTLLRDTTGVGVALLVVGERVVGQAAHLGAGHGPVVERVHGGTLGRDIRLVTARGGLRGCVGLARALLEHPVDFGAPHELLLAVVGEAGLVELLRDVLLPRLHPLLADLRSGRVPRGSGAVDHGVPGLLVPVQRCGGLGRGRLLRGPHRGFAGPSGVGDPLAGLDPVVVVSEVLQRFRRTRP